MTSILWIIYKDLHRYFADRTGAVMTVVMPVVLAALLGSLFAPRITGAARTSELLVVNHDTGPLGDALINALEDHDQVIIREVSADEARAELRDGRASVAVILPDDLSRQLNTTGLITGRSTQAQLLYDPSRAVESDLAAGVVLQTLMGEILASTASGEKRDLPLTFSRESVVGSNAGFNVYAHCFAGMLCMFLLFMAMEQARHLHQEREHGSLLRLRLSSASSTTILAGSLISTALISSVIACLVFLAGFLLFDVDIRGAAAGFALVVVALSFFAGGFSIFLAGIARSERQLVNLGTFFILLLSFAGGAWVPSFIMPDWIDAVSQFLPTHWATEGLARMTWRGMSLPDALIPAAALAAFGAISALIGARAFRWSER